MAEEKKPRVVASAVNKAKKAKSGKPGKALRRAAEVLEKVSARAKKARANVEKRARQLAGALLALEKNHVGSPKIRAVEEAARRALKELLSYRKKLRRALKALRRAEAKHRKAGERKPKSGAAPAGAKRASTKQRAQRRRASRKRLARTRTKGRAAQRAKRVAPKPKVMGTRPATEAASGAEGGGLAEIAGVSGAGAVRRQLE